MKGYLDIGTFSIRVMAPVPEAEDDDTVEDEQQEAGLRDFSEDTVAKDRQAAGKTREGWTNFKETVHELSDVCSGVEDEVGSLTYSVSVMDTKAISAIREAHVALKGNEIKQVDLLHLQKEINLEENSEYVILHRIPIGYRVDGGALTQDPVGVVANKLSYYVMLIAVTGKEASNYHKLISEADVRVRSYVYDGLAQGIAALRESNHRTATIVDLGAKVTGVSLWQEGRPVFFGQLPMGMDNITLELIRQLRCSTKEAERLKSQCGLDLSTRPLTFKLSDGRSQGSIDKATFDQILKNQLIKILFDVRKLAKTCDWPEPEQSYHQKMILTGGGRTMPGLLKLAQDNLKIDIAVVRGAQKTHGKTAFMGCLGLYWFEEDDLGQSALMKVKKIGPNKGGWAWIKEIFS